MRVKFSDNLRQSHFAKIVTIASGLLVAEAAAVRLVNRA
jgi:hypothetical protein